MKPVLMIHEFREEMLDLPLEDYVLTFDDGLYSQYYYFDKIKHLNTKMIFFISTNIICDGKQSMGFPPCHVAHEKSFAGNNEDYMTLEQIKELVKHPNVSIGGHSHYHKNIKDMFKLFDKARHVDEDTGLMLKWFKENLGFKPVDFCFPYNEDAGGLYQTFLTKFKFTNFYGRERTPIESLMNGNTLS